MEKDDIFEMVADFNEKFEASKDPQLWITLCEEELKEVKEAAAALLKELCDLAYVMTGLAVVAGEDEADRLLTAHPEFSSTNRTITDLLDVFPHEVVGKAFKRVHASNMSKLGDDGKPVRREDGKVMKGPNYKPPVLDDLIV